MNYNLKRHKLLEILATQNINKNLNVEGYNVLGVSFDSICKKLNVDEFELKKITSELYQQKEIGYHNTYDTVGLYADHFGITAYSNKKYLKLNNKYIIENLKNIVQVVIPILSLIVAFMAIYTKINTINERTEKELQQIKKEIQIIKKSKKENLTQTKLNIINNKKQ